MSTDALAKHYDTLTGAERFGLFIDALARDDRVEEGRLTDACPMVVRKTEDPAYRDRVRQSGIIALYVAMNAAAGLARIEDAVMMVRSGDVFDASCAPVMQLVFLYGRSVGLWEAGAAPEPEPPAAGALDEVAPGSPLVRFLDEVAACAGEPRKLVGAALLGAYGEAYAGDLLSLWEGLSRFCRGSMGIEPGTLMKAWGLRPQDLPAEVTAACPDARADEAKAAEWAARFGRKWVEHFGT